MTVTKEPPYYKQFFCNENQENQSRNWFSLKKTQTIYIFKQTVPSTAASSMETFYDFALHITTSVNKRRQSGSDKKKLQVNNQRKLYICSGDCPALFLACLLSI
jgi:hypothetical protein